MVHIRSNHDVYANQSASLSGRCLDVLVGPESPIPFSVHENLIRASSDFFDKAMSHDWKESEERSVSLPEEDPKTFQLYLHWLYCKTLPVKSDSIRNTELVKLAKAYVLGDRLLDLDFKDKVIDAIIDKSRSSSLGLYGYMLDPATAYIYKNTLEGSKARLLFVDLYLGEGDKAWLTDRSKILLPEDFLFDLASALIGKRPRSECDSPRMMNSTCRYHNHGPDDSICYRNRPKTRNGEAVDLFKSAQSVNGARKMKALG